MTVRKKLQITRAENGYIVRVLSEQQQQTLLVFPDLIALVEWQSRFLEGIEVRTTDSRKKNSKDQSYASAEI